MHFFSTIVTSVLVALSAAANTQDLVSQIPACAKTCLNNAAKNAGCDVSDIKCQCEKLIQMTGDARPCISSGCSVDDTSKTVSILSQVCVSVASQVGGDAFNSAVSKASSAATAGLAGATQLATSLAGAATKAPTTTGANGASTATPAAAGRNLAGVGFAAAVFALAL